MVNKFNKFHVPKLKLKLPNDSRRSFRLAPLEVMLGALIVVGLLYLATIWLGGLMAPEPEATTQARASVPSGQVKQALSASKKAIDRAKELDKRLATMSSRLDKLAAAEKKITARTPAGLERRLNGLEKQVATLGQGGRPAPAADTKLKARLDALDRT